MQIRYGLGAGKYKFWAQPRAKCPECGAPIMAVSGGCPYCPTCGWSKCG